MQNADELTYFEALEWIDPKETDRLIEALQITFHARYLYQGEERYTPQWKFGGEYHTQWKFHAWYVEFRSYHRAQPPYLVFPIFKMGSGMKGRAPTAYDVLSYCTCIWSGIRATSNLFQWARDFGYDAEDPHIQMLYESCLQEYDDIERFLGYARGHHSTITPARLEEVFRKIY